MKNKKRTVRAVLLDRKNLDHCVDDLHDAEFKASQITVFSSHLTEDRDKTRAIEGSLVGAGIGSAMGLAIGYFSTWSRTAPFMGAAVGLLIFGLLGVFGGGLLGRQIPTGYLKGYEPDLGDDEVQMAVEIIHDASVSHTIESHPH